MTAIRGPPPGNMELRECDTTKRQREEKCEGQSNIVTLTSKDSNDKHPNATRAKFIGFVNCSICVAGFPAQDQLIYHILSHTAGKLEARNLNSISPDKTQTFKKELTNISKVVTPEVVPFADNLVCIKPADYYCKLCDSSYISLEDLETHVGVHIDRRNHECHICLVCFRLSASLQSHLDSHEVGDSLWPQCGLRRTRFTGTEMYISHKSKMVFACTLCKCSFKTANSLKEHVFKCMSTPFLCNLCGDVFSMIEDLEAHVATHRYKKWTKSVNVDKIICPTKLTGGKKSMQVTAPHENNDHWSRVGEPATGGVSAVERNSDETHIFETHSDGNLCALTDDFLDTEFGNASCETLDSDADDPIIESQTPDKISTFQDTGTLEGTSENASLLPKTLNSTVGPEKRFSCEICTKRFSRKTHLKEHMNVHTGTKRVRCGKCKKGFTRKSNLTYHVKYQHPEFFDLLENSCEPKGMKAVNRSLTTENENPDSVGGRKDCHLSNHVTHRNNLQSTDMKSSKKKYQRLVEYKGKKMEGDSVENVGTRNIFLANKLEEGPVGDGETGQNHWKDMGNKSKENALEDDVTDQKPVIFPPPLETFKPESVGELNDDSNSNEGYYDQGFQHDHGDYISDEIVNRDMVYTHKPVVIEANQFPNTGDCDGMDESR